MKVLDLQCAHGHGFEGWFASHDDFESQLARDLVACPMCSDTRITKLLSAPRLNIGNPKPPASDAMSSSTAVVPAGAAAAAAGPEKLASPDARLLAAMRDLLAKTENVGDRFADEARKIHYGEAEERSIRGHATPEQTAALQEEGIAVMSLPIPAVLKETLQ